MPGCSWDLLVFGKNLDASGGDVALALAAGEDIFSADAAAGTGTKVKPKSDGWITAIGGRSEDGALANWRVSKVGMENRWGSSLFHAGEAEVKTVNQMLSRGCLKVTIDDLIRCEITNAAAKMDSVGCVIGRGIKPSISSQPINPIPEDAFPVEVTGATTLTADTWTAGAVSFPDYTLKQNKSYKIHMANWEGATMQWYRFKALAGPDVGNRPGLYGGDTDILTLPHYFSHPPQFTGKDGLHCQWLGSAGDTAQVGTLLLEEIPYQG